MSYNVYRNAIRDHIFAVTNRKDMSRILVWEVKEDEALDPTLLSLRAYGTRQHADVVMVASGVNGIWEKLPLQRISLPLLSDILRLRKIYIEGVSYE